MTFVVSGVGAYLIARHTDTAPRVAFENHLIFGGLLFLALFYGLLLLALPLVRAVFAGELPTELTMKGPRYGGEGLASYRLAAEDSGRRLDALNRTLSGRIQQTASSTAEGIDEIEVELRGLRKDLGAIAAQRNKDDFSDSGELSSDNG